MNASANARIEYISLYLLLQMINRIGVPTDVSHTVHATSIEEAQELIKKLMSGQRPSPAPNEGTPHSLVFIQSLGMRWCSWRVGVQICMMEHGGHNMKLFRKQVERYKQHFLVQEW